MVAPSDLKPGYPIGDSKDVLLKALKLFFSTHNEFTWSADSSNSVISISDAFASDKENKELLPAIVLQRGSFSWRNGHLAQKVYNNLQDKQQYLDLLTGTFTCLCVSTAGLEAERLAEDVFLFFTRFREAISTKGLFNLKNISIGSEQVRKSGSDTDSVLVPVQLQVVVEDNWTLVENGPSLEGFNLKINS
jgi:hypothetical protein